MNFQTPLTLLTRSVIALLVVAIVPAQAAMAISADDREAIYNNTVFYDPNDVCTQSSISVNIDESQVTKTVFEFFRSQGLSSLQAAVITGNFQHESANWTYRANANSIGAYGIAQWYKGRRTALQEFAAARGKTEADLESQLLFAWKELTGPYSDVLAQLKKETKLEEAVYNFEAVYEVSGHLGIDSRVNYAKAALEAYGGGDVSDAGGTESSTCAPVATDDSASTTLGDYAWPVAKKWWDQHPDWFTKPHHTYPAADIPVPSGTKVFSLIEGKVVIAGPDGDCGVAVFVVSGDVEVGYCHGTPGSVKVSVGDTVKAGDPVMLSDNTGHSTGPHLHVQVKIKGQLHCPQQIFKDLAANKEPDIKGLATSGCSY